MRDPFKFYTPLWLLLFTLLAVPSLAQEQENPQKGWISLPAPRASGPLSLEEALWKRHSTREFTAKQLTWQEIGQLCWAAQGINRPGAQKRTTPSAGSTYPLTLYLILPDGVYQYNPADHAVRQIQSSPIAALLPAAGLNSEMIQSAACIVVIGALLDRTEARFGTQARRYVYLEAGHAAQNLLLQAEALSLGGVPIGPDLTTAQRQALGMPAADEAVYLVLVGHPKP